MQIDRAQVPPLSLADSELKLIFVSTSDQTLKNRGCDCLAKHHCPRPERKIMSSSRHWEEVFSEIECCDTKTLIPGCQFSGEQQQVMEVYT